MDISTDNDIRQLLVNDTRLIDVRAPIEFAAGAFPSAINLPVLDDDERQKIGITYKEEGPEAATALGYQLVSGDIKTGRVAAWSELAANIEDIALYCFRGGQRSSIACEWLKEAGIEMPRVAGGYKRMRNLLLAEYEAPLPLIIVSGQTGCGKTVFLSDFDRVVDLEGHANHRGSAFGGKLDGQPAQIDFENAVAIQLLKLGKSAPIIMEDESRLIGRIHLPPVLQSAMAQSPILVLEESLEARATHIYKEYIVQQWSDYQDFHGEYALPKFSSYLLGAVDAIRKRLGNVAHAEVRAKITSALDDLPGGKTESHLDWITELLAVYYDPMYQYQLEKKQDRIVFRGSRAEASGWLTNYLTEQEPDISHA